MASFKQLRNCNGTNVVSWIVMAYFKNTIFIMTRSQLTLFYHALHDWIPTTSFKLWFEEDGHRSKYQLWLKEYIVYASCVLLCHTPLADSMMYECKWMVGLGTDKWWCYYIITWREGEELYWRTWVVSADIAAEEIFFISNYYLWLTVIFHLSFLTLKIQPTNCNPIVWWH
jgi:hypothetical protein